jgi:dicarboxylate transporter 10
MCADGAKPLAERFRYSDPFTALYRIGREEGLRVFGKGISANIGRSILMSMSPVSPSPSPSREYLCRCLRNANRAANKMYHR